MSKKPEYIAKRSAWTVCRFWEFVIFWLIVPALLFILGSSLLGDAIFGAIAAWYVVLLIILLIKVIIIKSHRVEFYRDRVVEKWGVFDVEKRIHVFTAVMAVKVDQKFAGRIFNYGEVKVDMVGPWDVDLTRIKKPKKLVNYLESRVARVRSMHQFMPN